MPRVFLRMWPIASSVLIGFSATNRASGLLAAAAGSVQAQFLQRLTSGVFAFEEGGYGVAVASSGDRVAVSELLGLTGGAPPVAGGAVEVWRREGAQLVREQRLLSPLPGQGHLFGEPRAIRDAVLAEADPPADFMRAQMRRAVGY
mgnify:CR=1 FL=1